MSNLPEFITAQEQAREAGLRQPSYVTNEIEELRQHCAAVIASLPGDPKGIGILQAKTKLTEMTHWLNYHVEAAKRGTTG